MCKSFFVCVQNLSDSNIPVHLSFTKVPTFHKFNLHQSFLQLFHDRPMLYFSATRLDRKEAEYTNMLTWWVLLTCLGLLSSEVAAFGRPGPGRSSLREVFSWNYIDYDFGSDAQRQSAIASGRYNHSNCVPIDVDHWRSKFFHIRLPVLRFTYCVN